MKHSNEIHRSKRLNVSCAQIGNSFRLSLLVVCFGFIPKPIFADSDPSCEIENVFSAQDVPDGALSLSSSGSTEKIEKILLPTKIETGKYSIEIKRIDSNLYSIVGSDTYIKTKYCYEYSYGDDAILNITSSYGFTKGKVIFLKR